MNMNKISRTAYAVGGNSALLTFTDVFLMHNYRFQPLRRAKKRVEDKRLKTEGKSDDRTDPHTDILAVDADEAIAEVAIPTAVGTVLGG